MWSRCRRCYCRCRSRPVAPSRRACAPRPRPSMAHRRRPVTTAAAPAPPAAGRNAACRRLAGPPSVTVTLDLTRAIAMTPAPAIEPRHPIGRSKPASPARAARRLTFPNFDFRHNVHLHAALHRSARCIVRRSNHDPHCFHCRRRSRRFGDIAGARSTTVTVGSLKISTPWARATPKGASVGGGYMKITNTGTAPDRLVGGSTDISSGFEVHEMKMEGGVMKMRPVAGGIEIKPGQTVDARPERLSRDVRRPEGATHARRSLQGDAGVRQGRQGRRRLRHREHRRQDRRRPRHAGYAGGTMGCR